jgi:hypothetical protein
MQVEILIGVGAWLFFLLAQSFFLNGIKIAASGETEIKPDGTEKDSPMVLYPIAKFFDQHVEYPVYYTGVEFDKLMKIIQQRFPDQWPIKYQYLRRDTRSLIQIDMEMSKVFEAIIKQQAATSGFKWEYVEEEGAYAFYKEYKKYRFSKWVRMPILGCIRCMPSYWSPITYWVPVLIVFGFQWWQVPLWVASIPSVTFLNTYISSKYST